MRASTAGTILGRYRTQNVNTFQKVTWEVKRQFVQFEFYRQRITVYCFQTQEHSFDVDLLLTGGL